MKDFLLQNWQFIAAGLIGLLEIIILIVKRGKTYVLPDNLMAKIVEFIKNAEDVIGSGNGDKKLAFVITQLRTFFGDNIKFIPDSVIKQFVEEVLETPQKKE